MVLHHIIIIALVQGITEFLPVSSSGHLVLSHALLDGNIHDIRWHKDDVTLDVAVHLGTLLSVLLYFHRDLTSMIIAFLKPSSDITDDQNVKNLPGQILCASLPVILAGFLLHYLSPDWIRSVTLVAWTTLIFGAVLWIADHYFPQHQTLSDMSYKNAFFIGCAQALALIPGTSRSGITMTAARFCGFSRTESARFSLLLAIVAIGGAGTLSAIDLIKSGDATLSLNVCIGFIFAFISGLVAIHLMMKWLEKYSFMPFVIYRLVLGLILLGFIYL